jgi:hypothetical protein
MPDQNTIRLNKVYNILLHIVDQLLSICNHENEDEFWLKITRKQIGSSSTEISKPLKNSLEKRREQWKAKVINKSTEDAIPNILTLLVPYLDKNWFSQWSQSMCGRYDQCDRLHINLKTSLNALFSE